MPGMIKRLIIWYLTVLSVLSVASAVVLRQVWPEHYPSLLYIIPLFFTVMLVVMIWLKNLNEKKGRDRSIFFLSYRIVKILLAIILLLVYFTAVGKELLAFAVVFMIFYLCLSMLETTLFMKEEKKG